MHEHTDRQGSFGAIPDLYDAARPSYPLEVVDAILTILDQVPRPRALEIGCGSGQATALFADKGLRITACDISPALLDLARTRLRAYPDIRLLAAKFEELPLAD